MERTEKLRDSFGMAVTAKSVDCRSWNMALWNDVKWLATEEDFVKPVYESGIQREDIKGRPEDKGINVVDQYWREGKLVGEAKNVLEQG